MPRIGERLHNPVVGNGDGGMSPRNGLLNDALGIGQGIHRGHLGMEMELHTLFGGGVLPLLTLATHNAEGTQLHLLAVMAQLHLTLHAKPHARIQLLRQGLGLRLIEGTTEGNAAFKVGHAACQHPKSGTAGLVDLHLEELSFYHHTAHLGIQFLHGGHFACKGLTHDDVAVTAVLCAVARVDIEPQLTKVILVHQQLTDGGNQRLRQGLTAADIHLHGAILRV